MEERFGALDLSSVEDFLRKTIEEMASQLHLRCFHKISCLLLQTRVPGHQAMLVFIVKELKLRKDTHFFVCLFLKKEERLTFKT